MKQLIFALSLLVASSAFAVEIDGGRVDAEKGVIKLDVSYGGGCKQHSFRLQVEGCLESDPVQCKAKLIDSGHGDLCEAYIQQTIEISLEKAGLTESYYSRASLTIKGDNTEIKLQLP